MVGYQGDIKVKQPQLPWLTCIVLPFLTELIFGSTIVLLWLFIPGYILIFKASDINNVDLIIFIYFACSWLYAVWIFFRHSIFIPKSLLRFPFFIKDVCWKRQSNRIIFLILVVLTVMTWQVLNKPEAKISNLDTIKSRLASVTESVDSAIKVMSLTLDSPKQKNTEFSIDGWNKFYKYPQLNQIPKDKDGIEALSKDYQQFLTYIKSRQEKIRENETSISSRETFFESKNMLVTKIEEEIKAVCTTNYNSQNAPTCSSILLKIQELRILISSGSQLLNNHKQHLNSIKNTFDIPDKSLAIWETKIEEIAGKFHFNTNSVNDWLSLANDHQKEAKYSILNAQKIKYLITKNYAGVIDSYSMRTNRFESEIIRSEKQSQVSVEAKIIIKKVKNTDIELANLNQEISNLSIELKSVDLQIAQALNQLSFQYNTHKQIAGGGYRLLVYARSNSEGKHYIDGIVDKKKTVDNLIQEISSLKDELYGFKNQFEANVQQQLLSLDKTAFLAKDLQIRNKKLKNKLEWVILRAFLVKIILGLVVIGILVGLAVYQHKKKLLARSRQLGTNLSELMPIITNPKEFLQIRLQAVNILEEHNLSNREDINEIKSVIRNLEKSSFRDDGAVASQIRKVADSLELRLTEQRKSL